MKKLFTNDKFFLAMVLVSILLCIANAIIAIVASTYISVALLAIGYAALCLVLYTSYKNHNKNVMKGIIGALLMLLVVNAAKFILNLSTPGWTEYPALAIISAAVIAFIFINHFVINSNRSASPVNIMLNKIALTLYAIVSIVWSVLDAVYFGGALYIVLSFICAVSIPCIIAVIVCVESRLDAYRLDREEAGWTEETGYPEGYVHEYQKK